MTKNQAVSANPLLAVILLLLGLPVLAQESPIRTETFTFEFDELQFSGLIDYPIEKTPQSLIILIPGSGKTNFSGQGGWTDWFKKLRTHFVKQGFAVCAWDKAGCGNSEGDFDGQQSVQSSAQEALAAIKQLRLKNVPGANQIGLWGISRAGWICPLIIQEAPSIKFWISVSGVDSLENSNYLLRTHLRISGRSDVEVESLMAERIAGSRVFRQGGSFDAYVAATQNLRKDSFNLKMYGTYNKGTYQADQALFMKSSDRFKYDEESGEMIFLAGFETILKQVNCPVLAIFGEQDSQVDWRGAKNLYEQTIGQNTHAALQIEVLSNCNHNIMQCENGGIFENLDQFNWEACLGYYELMANWLKEKRLN